MKLIIYYIQFLTLLFSYPHHTLAISIIQESFSNHSFQKTQHESLIISDDSQNLNDFFDDELLDTNDNDPVYSRKKISFKGISCTYITQNTSPNFFNNLHDKFYCQPHFYSPSFSDFISNRVLRL